MRHGLKSFSFEAICFFDALNNGVIVGSEMSVLNLLISSFDLLDQFDPRTRYLNLHALSSIILIVLPSKGSVLLYLPDHSLALCLFFWLIVRQIFPHIALCQLVSYFLDDGCPSRCIGGVVLLHLFLASLSTSSKFSHSIRNIDSTQDDFPELVAWVSQVDRFGEVDIVATDALHFNDYDIISKSVEYIWRSI